MIIEDKNFLSARSKKFIESTILSNNFPLYHSNYAVDANDAIENLTHVILRRQEDRSVNEPMHPLYHSFVKILDEFCNKHKISYREVLRICINFSYPSGSKKSAVHVDHEYKHDQLLIYLNDPKDKTSSTVLLDDKYKKVREVFPEKYKGIFFPKMPHYVNLPKKGGRFIAVFTLR